MSQAATIGIATRNPRIGRRLGLVAGAIVFVLAAVVAAGAWYMSYVPSDLDTSTSRPSEAGHYQVSYAPTPDPIPVNQLHAWTLEILTPEGAPVADAVVAIDGDMPQHGHGLPTQPQVTEYLGEGRYLVEGVKFQMGGWWVMDFEIASEGRPDRVRFEFVLP